MSTSGSDNTALRFVDGGGPHSYSQHYAQMLGRLSRSFLDAKERDRSAAKSASGDIPRASGIVRPPRRRAMPVKEATIVGGPNSSEMEKAFAQIAESYITDKAPLLTGYMLGFQLLKKTDDDTKACGIFAYKVGDELVYIPVFSINGDIQGHELMYVVSRDQFVPSDEKWVNFLLSRKPIEPGRIERRDRSEIPTHGSIRPTYMSSGLKLSSYTSLPVLDPMLVLDALRTVFKTASVGTPLLEHSFWRDVSVTRNRTIPMFRWKAASAVDLGLPALFQRSYKAVKLAERWSRDYPVFARLLDYVTDGEGLDAYRQVWEKKAEIARKLGVRAGTPKSLSQQLAERAVQKTAAPVKDGSVIVRELDAIPLSHFRMMPTAWIDRVHRDGYDVADTRDPTKLASIVIDGADRGLANPVGPGLYKVFMADGTFGECFVLYKEEPTGDGERDPCHLVLDKDTKQTCTANLNEIWTSSRDPDPNWLEKLPASNTSLNEKAEHEYERHEGVDSYLVTPAGHAWEGRFLEEGDKAYFEERAEVPVSLTSGSLKGFRTLASRHDGDGCLIAYAPVIAPKDTILRRYKNSRGTGRPLALGSRPLWMAMLLEGTLPVKVQKREGPFAEYAIDDQAAQHKSAALESLVVRHHLSRESAERLLKEADTAYPRGITRLREKVAFSGPVPQDPHHVTFPQKERGRHDITGLDIEQDLDTEEPVEALRPTKIPDEKETWPGLWDSETNSSGSLPAPNGSDMNLAAQASQAGQKEFVSSQMLLSLLREIDNDDIIAKYVHTFEKACDTLGRLYMQLLWRIDAFEERFGKTQFKEFKEMLVALFQQMGDFICYLRQRDIRPSPVLSLGATNINEEDGL